MSGYVMIPAWLLKRRPSANAILIYATLAAYGTFNTVAGVYEECRPPIARITEDSGTSDSTVKRALTELIELGAIERTERWAEDGKTRLPSVYRVVFGTISGPTGFTGEPTPQSTGGPRVGSPVTYNPEPSTQNPPTQKKEPSASPRGTRLHEDWMPSDETKEWVRLKVPPALYQKAGVELEKFRLYWLTKTGKDATKISWDLTFRKWMLNAADRYGTGPTSGAPAGAQFLSSQEQNLQRSKIRKARATITDELMATRGIPLDEAYALAEVMAEDFVLNGVVPSIGTGYIEAEVIDSDGRPEVTS